MSQPTASDSPKFPIGLTIASLIGIVILIALGVWQVKRLHWKEALLAKVAALESAAPIPVNQALTGGVASADLDFVRVSANCPDIEATPYIQLYTVSDARAGFRIITACKLSGAPYATLLVDRGYVPIETLIGWKNSGIHLSAPIVGVLRKGDGRNYFTPQNDPKKDLWYWRDIPTMAKALGAANAAPTFLMLEKPEPQGFYPKPAPIPADIPNNHLQYALTWFGLALSLLGVYLASLWKRLKP